MKRVLEQNAKLLAVAIVALSVLSSSQAHAQVGALDDQPSGQEAEGNVEMQINNTDGGDDDMMAIGGSLPCTIKLVGAEKDMTVVLVAPKVGFNPAVTRLSLSKSGVSNNSDGSLTVMLSKSGTPVDFSISGASGSNDVNDGKVEARKDSATGTIKQTEDASVYWFGMPSMKVEQGGGVYTANLSTGTLKANGIAVYLTAEQRLLPSDLPSIPEPLKNDKMGIVQNAMGTHFTAIYSDPILDNTRVGNSIKLKNKLIVTTFIPQSDDVWPGEPGPTYHTPVSVAVGVMRGVDAPYRIGGSSQKYYAVSENDNLVPVTYQKCESITLTPIFKNWCIRYNVVTLSAQQKAESGWKLDVGTGKTNQKSQVDGQVPPVTPMVLTTNSQDFSNALGTNNVQFNEDPNAEDVELQ